VKEKTRVYLRGRGRDFERFREELRKIAIENPNTLTLTVNGKVEP